MKDLHNIAPRLIYHTLASQCFGQPLLFISSSGPHHGHQKLGRTIHPRVQNLKCIFPTRKHPQLVLKKNWKEDSGIDNTLWNSSFRISEIDYFISSRVVMGDVGASHSTSEPSLHLQARGVSKAM